MDDIIRAVGSDPSVVPLQSVVPVAAAVAADPVPHEQDFPSDHYIVITTELRLGWFGDAVADDVYLPENSARARQPGDPAWTAPSVISVHLHRSDLVRSPTLSPRDDGNFDIAARPVANTASPFEPTLPWQRTFTSIRRSLLQSGRHRSPLLLTGFATSPAAHSYLGTLAAILIKAVQAVQPIRHQRWTVLIQNESDYGPPPPNQEDPGPYTVRSCKSACAACDTHDVILKAHRLHNNSSLRQIIDFSADLTRDQSGWHPHFPRQDVFRVPEESVPACTKDDIPADLRHQVQSFFDQQADSPPHAITARSPLYSYDSDGGVRLRFKDGVPLPSTCVRTITQPASITRRVMYTEILKDLVWRDLDEVPLSAIHASAILFVVFHRATGRPRVCAAPYEANEITEPAPVRYGVIWDLFSDNRLTCGCRGDIGRGFKHCRLALDSAKHVAFILDGIGLMPRSVYFGLRDGPRIFCSTLDVDLATVPNVPVPQGSAVSPLVTWVDDLSKLASDPVLMVRVFFALAHHLASRGWKEPPSKWFFLPAFLLKFIGYILDPPVAAARLSRSLAVKIACTARDILRQASVEAGSPVTQRQAAIVATHFGRLAFGAKDIPLIAYARTVVDRSVAEGRWRPGARDLITMHARDAAHWHALRSNNRIATPARRRLVLSSDASVATADSSATVRSLVTGGGHWWMDDGLLPDAAYDNPEEVPSRSFFSIKVDVDRFGLQGKEVSSTWAEACLAAFIVKKTEPLLPLVSEVVLKLDAATVVHRAPKCATESLQVSSFYAYMHRLVLAYKAKLTLLWHSRAVIEARMSDAVSSASTGLWSMIPSAKALARVILDAIASELSGVLTPDKAQPPATVAGVPSSSNPCQLTSHSSSASLKARSVHLFADDLSTIAPSYSTPYLPESSDRQTALRMVVKWSSSGLGLLGLPDSISWQGRIITATFTPSYLSWLPSIARNAAQASNWCLLLCAIMVPALTDTIHAMLLSGARCFAAWPVDPSVRWLIAPDGALPTWRFPVAWLLIGKGLPVTASDSIIRRLRSTIHRSTVLPSPRDCPPTPTREQLGALVRHAGRDSLAFARTRPSSASPVQPPVATVATASARSTRPRRSLLRQPPRRRLPSRRRLRRRGLRHTTWLRRAIAAAQPHRRLDLSLDGHQVLVTRSILVHDDGSYTRWNDLMDIIEARMAGRALHRGVASDRSASTAPRASGSHGRRSWVTDASSVTGTAATARSSTDRASVAASAPMPADASAHAEQSPRRSAAHRRDAARSARHQQASAVSAQRVSAARARPDSVIPGATRHAHAAGSGATVAIASASRQRAHAHAHVSAWQAAQGRRRVLLRQAMLEEAAMSADGDSQHQSRSSASFRPSHSTDSSSNASSLSQQHSHPGRSARGRHAQSSRTRTSAPSRSRMPAAAAMATGAASAAQARGLQASRPVRSGALPPRTRAAMARPGPRSHSRSASARAGVAASDHGSDPLSPISLSSGNSHASQTSPKRDVASHHSSQHSH